MVVTTVMELMDALQAAVAERGPRVRTAPVRLALDPDDPAEHAIGHLHLSAQPDAEHGHPDRTVLVLYLAQGERLHRLPPASCRELGWQE